MEVHLSSNHSRVLETLLLNIIFTGASISPALPMAFTCCLVLVLLWVCDTASTMDYGGIPLWTDYMASEPSVLSLQGRMDRAWFRANNPQDCPQQCDCPIQWPTAIYCDHRGLTDIPDQAPVKTQYLFLQVGKMLTWAELGLCWLSTRFFSS